MAPVIQTFIKAQRTTQDSSKLGHSIGDIMTELGLTGWSDMLIGIGSSHSLSACLFHP